MKLAAYMDLRNIKDVELARMLGKNRSTVTKLRLGTAVPSFALLTKIEQITDGAVTYRDFASEQAA